MKYAIRIIKPTDSNLLKDFLQQAISDSDEQQVIISRYIEDWGKPGDMGFTIKEENKLIGAAWLRQFSSDNPGFGFIDERVPEVSVVVLPEYRELGLDWDLLTRLIEQAQLEGFPALSLSIDKKDPSVDFYQRLNFESVRETDNRRVLQRVL